MFFDSVDQFVVPFGEVVVRPDDVEVVADQVSDCSSGRGWLSFIAAAGVTQVSPFGSRIGNATIIFSLICNTIIGHAPSLKTLQSERPLRIGTGMSLLSLIFLSAVIDTNDTDDFDQSEQ